MAVILQMTYQKKLGLPNYSSHSCSVALTVEIPDAGAAAQETAQLYAQLQAAVDREIQHVGYMPDATTYGMNNGSTQDRQHSLPQGAGHRPAPATSTSPSRAQEREPWNCTEGQRGLILRIINENQLNKQDVEEQAQQLFGRGVRDLDKMQASQLIEELLEKTDRKPAGQRRWSRTPART